MTLAEFLAECAAIEARVATTGIRHDDIVLLRRAVYAWRDAGQPTEGPVFVAYQAAVGAVDVAATRALEVAIAENERRHLIEKLQGEVDQLNRELARSATVATRKERARLAQLRAEHGATEAA